MNTKKQGLSSEEAQKLLEKYGENIIKEKKYNPLKEFFKKFIGPIPVMIEIALVLSAFAHKWEDFTIISVLLAVNIGVEFFQESKAQKVLESLKKNLALKTLVLRDGKFQEIPASEIVPGDIVKLNIGDIFPADGIILKENSASVNQSTVTGESLPVDKKVSDEVYSGTILEKGQVLVEITKTGSKTSMGKIVSLIKKGEEEEVSHFQKAILSISKFLIILSVVMVIITSIFLYYRGDDILEILRFALVLAIASIPIALPAVLSVTMAIGAGVLARKKALVSNLKAVEELAGIDQLCVDKTGTLTKNKIEVTKPKVFNNFSLKELFNFAFLALGGGDKNPIEKAIEKYAKEKKILENEKIEVQKIIPFDPIRKRTEVILKNGKTLILGAPQIIIEMLSDKEEKDKIDEENSLLGEQGIRSILLALKNNDETKIVGIIPLLDPPRDDSKKVIEEVKKYGVNIKMLTGDNIAIAKYISNLLNIGKNIIENSFLNGVGKNDKDELIRKTDVFAEVVPEDKFNIVSALQEKNHIVAMTGDGVNDAPALKKADVGIAVSGASQAARSSADIVLLSDGLSVIKDAIKIARETFWRMQSYATFRISETVRVILFISLSIIFFGSEPLTAVMIILLALLNDIPVMAIAYDNAKISEKPVRWHLKETLFIASVLGALGLISSFSLFYWLMHYSGLAIGVIQTIIFLKLDVAGHSTLYLTRAGKKHFWARPYPSLKFFIPAYSSRLIGMIIVYFGILMTPISLGTIGLIWVYAITWFFIGDQVKVLAWKILDRAKEKKKGLIWRIVYKK